MCFAGNPLPVVSWLKNEVCVDESPDYVITYNNGECVLHFEEVFMEDAASYLCKAKNDLGEDQTSTTLEVVGELERTLFSLIIWQELPVLLVSGGVRTWISKLFHNTNQLFFLE